jgi:hypothetical protein
MKIKKPHRSEANIVFMKELKQSILNNLLNMIAAKIDLEKCVSVMKKTGFIALIEPFLKSV